MDLLNLNDLSMYDSNGNKIMKKNKDYIHEAQKKITFKESLFIGDYIKLKNSPLIIKILYVHYFIPALNCYVDYGGKSIWNENSEEITIFNQKDIERKCTPQEVKNLLKLTKEEKNYLLNIYK